MKGNAGEGENMVNKKLPEKECATATKLEAQLFQTLLLLLCAVILVLFPASAAAGSGAVLAVQGAFGEAGESISVTVSLSGIKSLSGVEGLSGGEFELGYDPVAASIKKISRGSIVGGGFFFYSNKNFSASSVKVVLAAASGLITEDGDLCHVVFEMKKKGMLEVVLEEIAFCDQDTRPLTVGAAMDLSGDSIPNGSPALYKKPPSGAGVTAVVLFPPDDDLTPDEQEHPSSVPGSGGKAAAKKGGKRVALSKEAPGSSGDRADDPTDTPEDEAATCRFFDSARRWALPAAIVLVTAIAGTAIYFFRVHLQRTGSIQEKGEP